jgi:hypothetical protein
LEDKKVDLTLTGPMRLPVQEEGRSKGHMQQKRPDLEGSGYVSRADSKRGVSNVTPQDLTLGGARFRVEAHKAAA